MSVTRWDPTRDLESFQTDMNRLFDGVFRSANGGRARRWIPAADLRDGGDSLVLEVDLPGMSEEDIQVEVNDSVLTVSGERKSEHDESGDQFYRSERTFGQFTRSLTLPENVDADSISGSFDRGVLELRVPKPVKKQPKRVEIRSGARENGNSRTIEGSATED